MEGDSTISCDDGGSWSSNTVCIIKGIYNIFMKLIIVYLVLLSDIFSPKWKPTKES